MLHDLGEYAIMYNVIDSFDTEELEEMEYYNTHSAVDVDDNRNWDDVPFGEFSLDEAAYGDEVMPLLRAEDHTEAAITSFVGRRVG